MHAKLILRWWSYKVIRLKAHSFNQTVTTFAVSSALFNFIITYYWNMSPHWVFKIVGLQSQKHCNVGKSYLVLFLPRNHPRDIIFPFLGHCDLVVVCSINYIISSTYLIHFFRKYDLQVPYDFNFFNFLFPILQLER